MGTWSLVKSAGPTSGQSATFASAVGSGNIIVGFMVYDDSFGTATTTTDDKSNSYTTATVDDTDFNQNLYSFYVGNVTNGPVTVTVSNTGSLLSPYTYIQEWSNTDGATVANPQSGSSVGQYQASPGTGTDAITSTASTPADNGCLIIGYTQNTGGTAGTLSAGTGFGTLDLNSTAPGVRVAAEHQTQATAASIAATFTNTSNQHFTTRMYMFKPPVVAGGAVTDHYADKLLTQSLFLRPRFLIK